MVKLRLCRCGKCKVDCFLHGKKAKCEECGKIAKLGTEIRDNGIRYICDKCCETLKKAAEEAEAKLINKELQSMRKKPAIGNRRCRRYGSMDT